MCVTYHLPILLLVMLVLYLQDVPFQPPGFFVPRKIRYLVQKNTLLMQPVHPHITGSNDHSFHTKRQVGSVQSILPPATYGKTKSENKHTYLARRYTHTTYLIPPSGNPSSNSPLIFPQTTFLLKLVVSGHQFLLFLLSKVDPSYAPSIIF